MRVNLGKGSGVPGIYPFMPGSVQKRLRTSPVWRREREEKKMHLDLLHLENAGAFGGGTLADLSRLSGSIQNHSKSRHENGRE